MATKDLGYNSRPNNCTVASTSADIRTGASSFCYPYDNNCIRKCRAWNCANKAFYHTIGYWRSPDRVVALRSLLLLLSRNSRHTSQNIKKNNRPAQVCVFLLSTVLLKRSQHVQERWIAERKMDQLLLLSNNFHRRHCQAIKQNGQIRSRRFQRTKRTSWQFHDQVSLVVSLKVWLFKIQPGCLFSFLGSSGGSVCSSMANNNDHTPY